MTATTRISRQGEVFAGRTFLGEIEHTARGWVAKHRSPIADTTHATRNDAVTALRKSS